METPEELRAMFGLPSMSKDVADSIGLEFDEFIEVELPVKQKRQYKSRGRSFTSEENNPQKARWRCLGCDMESNITGILRHQKVSGHKGKQRVFAQLEKLGVV